MSQSPKSGNAKPPAPRSSSNAFDQLWQKTQPVLNQTAARSLRGIIWLLEQALVKVEPNAPEAPRIATEKPPALFRQIGRAWAWLLKTIRSILPRSQREKLSDTALSSIILGTVLLVLWVNSALKPKAAPELIVASRPAIEQPAPDIAIPDALPAPANPTPAVEPAIEPVEPAPEGGEAIEPAEPEAIETPVEEVPAVESEPEISEPEVSQPEPEPEPEAIELPVEPEAEVAEEPLPEVPVEKVIEPVPPQLTPEQTLVAAVQDQVGNLTNQYGNGLIQNIQANFHSGRLTVKINDSWYELSEARQNQLASEMLDRARSLDFRRLEIIDSQETLVARSPIVGSEMIILQRSIE